jgi:tyrosine-protein kinase Etk/Wzc
VAAARLAQFKDEHKAWSAADQAGLLLRSQRELLDAQAHAETEAAEIANRVAELRRQIATLPGTVPLTQTVMHDPVVDELRKQLGTTEAQIAQSGVVLGERSPQIASLRQEAASLRASIAARSSTRRDQELTGTNQRLIDAQREIAAGEARLAGLDAVRARQAEELATTERDIREIAGTQQELERLGREQALLDRKYQLYTNGLEDSRITEALDLAKISNVRVVSAPVAGATPVYPPVVLVLVGGLIVGLGGSLAFVLFRDAIFPRARVPREIEDMLGVPVLTSIPEDRLLRARA